jgi:hypothetical protein
MRVALAAMVPIASRLCCAAPTTRSATASRRCSCRSIRVDRVARLMRCGERTRQLVPGTLSAWIGLQFPRLPGVGVRGVCRMMVTEMDEHFSLT